MERSVNCNCTSESSNCELFQVTLKDKDDVICSTKINFQTIYLEK